MVEFETIEVTSEDGLVMVELEWIGEGISGDYQEDDLEDQPLLRYSLYRKFTEDVDREAFGHICDGDAYEAGEWAAVQDGSYCTQLSALSSREKLTEAAKEILAFVENGVRDLTREKRLYERMSWIGLDDDGITFD